MEKNIKIIKILEHGTAYFIDKYGRLSSYPILADGKLESGAEVDVEQSPASFRKVHKEVLKKLGVPEEIIPNILKHVYYY